MIGLTRQGMFACARERPAPDLGGDCLCALQVECPPERMGSSASLSRAEKQMFSAQMVQSFQVCKSVAASRNLNLLTDVQFEFHRQSVSNLRERNKINACGQSFVTGAISFNKCHVSLHARLRSAVGERGKWSGGGEGVPNESQPERNARHRAVDGSPPRLWYRTMQARDERAV